MRVSIFTDSFFPYISGVSSAVCNQANEMVRRGHDVTIFRPKPKRADRDEGVGALADSITIQDIPFSVSVRNIPNLHVALPVFVSSLFHMRRNEPDVVHVHTEFGCGIEGLMLARMRGIPAVGTFHTFFAEPNYLKQFYIPNTSLTRRAMWKYSVTFFNRCRTIISPSQSVKDYLMRWGIAQEPVVMSNGIDRPNLKPDDEIRAMREAWGIDDFAFVYVGRVSPEKSLEVVLEAFREIHRGFPRTKFVMIGAGPSVKRLEQRIRQYGLDRAVIRTGRIDRTRLMRDNLLRLGDAFVTASKTENQPVSILEAMTFGLPIVGARAKGIPELVDHEKNGFLFEPDSVEQLVRQMKVLIRNRDWTRSMGRHSLRMAAFHHIDVVGDRLEQLYAEAMLTKAKGKPGMN